MSGMMVERLDHVLMTRFSLRELRSSTFFSKWSSTKGPFFRLRGMSLPPGAASTPAANDELLGRFGLVTGPALRFAPRRHRMAAARALALPATERMVDRVHGNT